MVRTLPLSLSAEPTSSAWGGPRSRWASSSVVAHNQTLTLLSASLGVPRPTGRSVSSRLCLEETERFLSASALKSLPNVSAARVAQLWVYPVKSMRGERLSTALVRAEGLEGDRRLMVASAGGQLLTQREAPLLATLSARSEAGGIVVISAPTKAETLTLRLQRQGELREASLWNQKVKLVDLGEQAAQWVTRALGGAGSLLPLFGLPSHRILHAPRPTGRPGGLADLAPIHLVCEASLADLNVRRAAARLPPVPMDRFRPNIVVAGCAPYEEDSWTHISIGGASFVKMSRCPRCTVPDVDQVSGKVDAADRGPMRSLRGYRAFAGEGVVFGIYLTPTRLGSVSEGDRVRLA